jgi:hypothetical protein
MTQSQGGSGSAQKVDFEVDFSRCDYRLVGAALASIEAYETCFRQPKCPHVSLDGPMNLTVPVQMRGYSCPRRSTGCSAKLA